MASPPDFQLALQGLQEPQVGQQERRLALWQLRLQRLWQLLPDHADV